MSKAKQRANQWGHRAETYALWILRFKGYRLIARRFKTPVGEIDLMMRRGKTVCVVEVKARRNLREGLEAVSPQAQARIRRAAEWWLAQEGKSTLQAMRFDLMVISKTSWKHIQNAF